MEKRFSVEELIIDDDFIRYCLLEMEADKKNWNQYLLQYPDEKNNLEEARRWVIDLTTLADAEQQEVALSQFKAILQSKWSLPSPAKAETAPRRSGIRRYAVATSVAAGLLLAVGLLFFLQPGNRTPTRAISPPSEPAADLPVVFTTGYGQKKTIYLPDSSRVQLNAGSYLLISDNFGAADRQVYLRGEAFFDVNRDRSRPFIVHADGFDVRVLGTVFNVKAYPSDRLSEAALIGGKIEVLLKGNVADSFALHPNQKAVIDRIDAKHSISAATDIKKTAYAGRLEASVKPLTILTPGEPAAEMAWTLGRLEIPDLDFSEIALLLERRYNKRIVFASQRVQRYRFTATFEEESLDEVLKALQLSYPFAYTYAEKNNEVLIKDK